MKGGRKGAFHAQAFVYHHLGLRLRLSEVIKRQLHGGLNQMVFSHSTKRTELYLSSVLKLPYSLLKVLVKWALWGRQAALYPLFDAAAALGVCLSPLRGVWHHPCWMQDLAPTGPK